MSWNGEVALFANGFIQGDGFCRMYAPLLSGSSKPPIPILLTGSEIPVGSGKLPSAETPFLLMAGGRSLSDEGKRIKEVVSPAKLQSYLVKWRAFKVRMKSNYADNPLIIQTNLVPVQKKVNKQLQTVLVEEKTIAQLDLLLESWLYLKYNDGTDAAPRSRAFALGFAGGCCAVLLFSVVFLIFIFPHKWE
jgi:hypothetical protein